MALIQKLLLAFIPLLCFGVLPIAGYVKDTIYFPRTILVLLLVLVGGLALFSTQNKNRSLLQALGRWPRHWRGWGLALPVYVVWLLLSAGFSSMPGYSWLGHPYTQFGVLMLLGCLALSEIYARAIPVEKAIKVLTVCTAVMAALTVVESLGFKPLQQVVNSPNLLYPAATVGHRPHLGGWFAAVALAPAFFYRRRRVDAWFWVWIGSALVGIALCKTTSATLGVGVGLLLWLSISVLQHHFSRKAVVISLAAFALSVGILPSLTQTVGKLLGLPTPQLKTYDSTASFKPRLYMWKSAWNAALERPVFGWGTDTFGYQVFDHLSNADAEALFRAELGFGPDYKLKHNGITYYAYRPNIKDKDAQTGSLLYVRPHSIIFDELYSNGILGFLLFIISLYALFVGVRRNEIKATPWFMVALLPYFIYLLAWFYVVSVTPLAFILLGIMLADLKGEEPSIQQVATS